MQLPVTWLSCVCVQWTLTAGLQQRIQALEIIHYGMILEISWKTSWPLPRREWCRHAIKTNNLAIAFLQGTKLVKRRGRQRKNWQCHWLGSKIIYRHSDIGMQLKYMEGAGQLLVCAVTLRLHSVMELMILSVSHEYYRINWSSSSP